MNSLPVFDQRRHVGLEGEAHGAAHRGDGGGGSVKAHRLTGGQAEAGSHWPGGRTCMIQS